MRVVFACAGTGGHINPAIAIANMIIKNEPDSKVLFIGSKTGMENEIVPKSGYHIKSIRTGKILRKITLKNFKAIFNAYMGISDSKKILKDFKPDIVIGTGGYICVPVMFAAKSLHIPYVLHESNAFPGVATKLLSKNADKVFIGFEDAKNRINKKALVEYTGTPTKFTRADVDKLSRSECINRIGLHDKDNKIILVTCGSQGAMKINNIVLDLVVNKLDESLYFVLVTGKNNYDIIKNKLKELESKLNMNLDRFIRLEKFVFNMEDMYVASDVCVTRAGAMTVTELEIVGKPSILIPLPTAAENHQYYNAKVLEKKGIAKIILEQELSIDNLYDTIKSFVSNNAPNRNSSDISNDVCCKIYKSIKGIVK